MLAKPKEEFMWAALVGGAIGATAALLLTPVSGNDLLKQIKRGFSQINNVEKIPKKMVAARKPKKNPKARPKKKHVA